MIKWRKLYKPDGSDEALYGVGYGARVACQDGPCRRIFRVEDERASTFQQLGGAVQHRTSRAQDRLLSCRALERKDKNNNQKDNFAPPLKSTHICWTAFSQTRITFGLTGTNLKNPIQNHQRKKRGKCTRIPTETTQYKESLKRGRSWICTQENSQSFRSPSLTISS